MANLNDVAENKVLEAILRNVTLTSFAPYLGLFSVAPTDTAGGTEITGNGYARQALTCGAAAVGSISNSVAILFPAQTPAVWVPVAWGIFDASTAGLLWFFGSYAFPTYNIGDQIQIAIGALTVTAD